MPLVQHVARNNVTSFCVEMWRAFGRALRVSQWVRVTLQRRTSPDFTRSFLFRSFFTVVWLSHNKQLGAAYTKERRMRFETNYFLSNSTQDMIFSVVAVTLRSKSLHRGLSTSRAHNTTARTTSQLSQKVLLLECLKKHNLSNAIKARLLNCLKKYNFSHFLKGTTSNILKNPNSRMS